MNTNTDSVGPYKRCGPPAYSIIIFLSKPIPEDLRGFLFHEAVIGENSVQFWTRASWPQVSAHAHLITQVKGKATCVLHLDPTVVYAELEEKRGGGGGMDVRVLHVGKRRGDFPGRTVTRKQGTRQALDFASNNCFTMTVWLPSSHQCPFQTDHT